MKKILLGLLLLNIFACKPEPQTKEAEKDIATVVVKIPNAENKKLVLSVTGEDFKNRITKKVKDGQVIFDVPYHYSDIAWVESEYNLNNFDHQRAGIPVLLEPDSILVSSKLIKDSIQITETDFAPFFVFEAPVFSEGRNNELKSASDKLFALTKGITYNYKILDSLNNTVFPEIRKKGINFFETEFRTLDQRIQAELLYKMLNFSSFEPKYLNEEEKSKINTIYTNFSNIKQTSDYRYKLLENKIEEINRFNHPEKLTFTNFSLKDEKNNTVELTDLVKQNDYTVLYFWFSSCGPCRRFNSRLEEKILSDLSKKGIEIVSINTDFNESKWKSASKKDDIFWTNLYGGNITNDLEIAYRIKGYPTKVIIDKDFNIIDFKFSNPDELLGLVKE